jgi:hypothetical protein
MLIILIAKETSMDDRERAIARKIYELHLQLWDAQGDEIAALRRATEALQKSHETIGELMKLTGELIGFS